MIVKVGERIYSGNSTPIAIRFSQEEWKTVLESPALDYLKTDPDKKSFVLVVGPSRAFLEKDAKQFGDDLDLSQLCSCGFCVCTAEDKYKIALELDDAD